MGGGGYQNPFIKAVLAGISGIGMRAQVMIITLLPFFLVKLCHGYRRPLQINTLVSALPLDEKFVAGHLEERGGV